MKIYIGNLSFETTEEDLQLACTEFGTVVSITITKNKSFGQPKGFAFVEMSSAAEGQAAIAGLNGKELKGRELKVNEARPRNESFRGGSGGGQGAYGGHRSGKREFGGGRKTYDGGKGGYGGGGKKGFGRGAGRGR